MAMVDCSCCQNPSEARTMTECRRCGRGLCPQCADAGKGYCPDCQQ